ncbi:hypothetical protein BHM03_00045378, partial [Ensete ventricosum]
KVEVRLVLRAPSQKFKILIISNILAYGKSYEHGFMKKYDSYKLCTKSRFDLFSCTILNIQNTGHSQCIIIFGK